LSKSIDQSQLLGKIENKLFQILNQDQTIKPLSDAMCYCVLGGGKRIRPLLTIATGALSGAHLNDLINVGCAIELIHCYSLVHDDLPVMDNDDLRRGQPTCHKKYNEATAILVGDALQALTFKVLSDNEINISDTNKLQIIQLIATCAGGSGMVGGQMLDLHSTGHKLDLQSLKKMHELKTGALIKGSILAGYLCGKDVNLTVYAELKKIANEIGLLFQIIDDVLDNVEDTATLGKTANKDAVNDKATYVSILGLDKAKQAADKLYNEIIVKLTKITANKMLIDLTNSIYNRNK
jgi:farnesyl diphosphate synthase